MASSISKQLKLIVSVDGIGGAISKIKEFSATIFFIGEAYNKVKNVLSGVIGVITDLISASMRQSAMNKQMESALKLTGNAYRGTYDQAQKYIQTLQGMSGLADDRLIPAFNEILLITDDLDSAFEGTKLAADLSASGLMDFEGASRLISLAMEGNTEVLGRYFPQLKTSYGLIKDNMSASEKWAIAQDVLKSKTEGMAASMRDTLAGSLSNLKNSWGDLEERVGQVFEGMAKTVVEGSTKIVSWLDKQISSISTLITFTQQYQIELENLEKIKRGEPGSAELAARAAAALRAGGIDVPEVEDPREQIKRILQNDRLDVIQRIDALKTFNSQLVTEVYADLAAKLEKADAEKAKKQAIKDAEALKVRLSNIKAMKFDLSTTTWDFMQDNPMMQQGDFFTQLFFPKDAQEKISQMADMTLQTTLEKINTWMPAAAGAFTNLFDLIALNANSAERRTLNALTSIVNAVPNVLNQISIIQTASSALGAASGIFGLVGAGIGLITSLVGGGRDSERQAAEQAKEERAARRYAGVSRGTPQYISINPSVSINGEMVFLGDNGEVTAQKISARIVADIKNTTDSGELSLAGLIPA